MSEQGSPTGTTSDPNPTSPGTGNGSATSTTTEPTAPLWFGERSSDSRYPTAHPAPTTWSTPTSPALQPATSSQPQQRRQWPGVVAAAVLAAVLASGGTYAALRADDGGTNTPLAASSSATQTSGNSGRTISQISPNAPDWAATAATAAPSVVAIQVQVPGGSAQGSGVIIDKQGHILTNNHVVEGAEAGTIEVTLADGRIFKATVAGTDPSTDLAVVTLSSPPGDLTPMALGDSDALKVGDPVMAVGNPLGLAGTVTTGIVSALNRPVTTGDNSQQQSSQQSEPVVTNAIQTSAAINPGNSGGALVNANGELVGINSSIAQTSSSGGNIGIGFAIPVNEAKMISSQLIAKGSAEHAYLGVVPVDGQAAEGSATRAGAKLSTVEAGTPAAAAGLQVGDVVIAVNGTPIESATALVAHIREDSVGSSVKLTVLRDSKRIELTAVLKARPAN